MLSSSHLPAFTDQQRLFMQKTTANINLTALPITEKVIAQINKDIAADAFSLPLSGRSSKLYSQVSPPIELIENVQFPDYLLSQLNSVECKCFMGLFPEIKRVWLTIDNRLTLWNYEDP
jgi:hypothetical protein